MEVRAAAVDCRKSALAEPSRNSSVAFVAVAVG
jgi:hypothetical protein